jgi:hypothetical protein
LINDQLSAIQKFWDHKKNNQRTNDSKNKVAYVLPFDYGYDFRGLNGSVWGIWKADSFSDQQYTNVNNVLKLYASKLDVIFDDSSFFKNLNQYSRLIYWNGTITS